MTIKQLLLISIGCSSALYAGQVYHIKSEQELSSLLAQGKPTLLKFSKNGCSPCDVMKPVFEQMATEIDSVIFISVHDETQPTIARPLRSRYGASSSPTIIVFDKNGKQIDKAVGGPMTARDVRIDLSGMIAQAQGKKMMPYQQGPASYPTKPISKSQSHAAQPQWQKPPQAQNGGPKQPQRQPIQRKTLRKPLRLQCEVLDDDQD